MGGINSTFQRRALLVLLKTLVPAGENAEVYVTEGDVPQRDAGAVPRNLQAIGIF